VLPKVRTRVSSASLKHKPIQGPAFLGAASAMPSSTTPRWKMYAESETEIEISANEAVNIQKKHHGRGESRNQRRARGAAQGANRATRKSPIRFEMRHQEMSEKIWVFLKGRRGTTNPTNSRSRFGAKSAQTTAASGPFDFLGVGSHRSHQLAGSEHQPP
jgi:hypothetical protein